MDEEEEDLLSTNFDSNATPEEEDNEEDVDDIVIPKEEYIYEPDTFGVEDNDPMATTTEEGISNNIVDPDQFDIERHVENDENVTEILP